jgi:hypothetical protein
MGQQGRYRSEVLDLWFALDRGAVRIYSGEGAKERELLTPEEHERRLKEEALWKLQQATSALEEERRLKEEALLQAERAVALAQAEALLVVMSSRGLVIPANVAETIRACTSPDQLAKWLLRALTASSAEQVLSETL